jgi:hypothetical protein
MHQRGSIVATAESCVYLRKVTLADYSVCIQVRAIAKSSAVYILQVVT